MGIIVVGASDQAEVVLWLLQRASLEDQVDDVVDADPGGQYVGAEVAGHVIRRTVDDLDGKGLQDLIIPAIGDGDLRRYACERADALGIALGVVIDGTALVASSAKVGAGTVVAPGAVLGPHAQVGQGSIINTGAIIEHHATVMNYCHVGPGAVLAGHACIEDLTLVGAGAVLRDGVTVGGRSTVGAGSVVIRDVEGGSVVVGVPARPIRRLH